MATVTFTFPHNGKDYKWDISDRAFMDVYDEGVGMANAFLRSSDDMLSKKNQKKAAHIIKTHVLNTLLGIDVGEYVAG